MIGKNFLVSSSSKAKQTNMQKIPQENEHLWKIFYLRVLLFGTLVAAAAVVSTLSNVVLKDNENERFTAQYDSISSSGLQSVADSFSRSSVGLREMASTFSHIYPNVSNYPNIAWTGYQNTASLLVNISAVKNIGVVPIVKPSELADYEAFMKAYYPTDKYIIQPQAMGGIQAGDVYYLMDYYYPMPDTTGVQPDSPYVYLAPVSQLTYSDVFGPQFYNFNLRSFTVFRGVIDQIMKCSESDYISDKPSTCGGISESVPTPLQVPGFPAPPVEDVQALLAHPLFPANNLTHLVGYTIAAVSWQGILERAVPTFVNGLDCVVTTRSGTAFTYTIIDGKPVFKGLGDHHDKSYNRYRRSTILDANKEHVTNAVTYEIAFYPRDEFVENYTTINPIIAPVVIVLVFVFCCVIFFTYDVLMKREFSRKQAILDTKRRFVRFISHEIRTPLNTVRLGLKLLDGELEGVGALIKATPLEDLPALFLATTEAWRHLTDDISTNSASAVEVLDDLLNYDKIEMGNLRLELTMFNVWDLTRRTTSIMQMQAQQKNIVLELTCDGVLVSGSTELSHVFANLPSTCVIGDAARLGQVLKNLMSNALKFTPAGGFVSVTAVTVDNGMPDVQIPAQKSSYSAIDTEDEVRAGSIQISVKDSGAGLTEKQLLEICSEGVQFNANELQAGQGSGLGLFISKGIVEQHGGTLSVASEGLGKGVTFTVELPLYMPSGGTSQAPSKTIDKDMWSSGTNAAALSDASAVPLLTRATTTVDVRRTLVVDDSHFNRKMLARLLTSRGFTCEQAEDGEVAIQVYQDMCERNEPPDAILMDFEMPVMNGPTATKKLRELGCACLIVGVTGNILPEDINNFVAHGADAVLAKPLMVETFEVMLSKHLFKHNRAVSDDQTAAPSTSLRPKTTGGQTPPLLQSVQVHPDTDQVRKII